ncbi:YdhK family protein [Paenibacillus sp. HB172176]|uniref:YdhK family protein n=1 Tax=Paenibacillus sp. HB172176 TaxID=2493690 RepID=UPI001F0EFABA|nr:YdhK family protein [Paenibacillus sp. HB172176]
MRTSIAIAAAAAMLATALSGCTNHHISDAGQAPDSGYEASNHTNMALGASTGMDMLHSSSAELPEGLQAAEHPKFKIGSSVILHADHMPGMEGANATIVGAYNTIACAVTYTPTTGGDEVKDHKWVIREELRNAIRSALYPGNEVVLEADHMNGMAGARGTIDSAEKTVVYMVDYTPADGGEMVKNHKWVTEDELSY